MVYLYFNKYKLFPLLFKIFVILNFVFILFDYFAADLIPEVAQIGDNGESLKTLIQSFFYMLIWGSYMHVSKRVKNTFIEDDYRVLKGSAMTVIIIAGLLLISLFSQVDYKALIEGKGTETSQQERIIKSSSEITIVDLDNFYQIDVNKNNLKVLPNIKTINEEASMGFKSKNGTYTLIIPEEIDSETKEIFNTTYDDSLLEELEKVYTDSFGLSITKSEITKRRGDKFYEFSGNSVIDGTDVYYNIGYALNGSSGLNIYTYGYSKDIVEKEGKKFLDNMMMEDKHH